MRLILGGLLMLCVWGCASSEYTCPNPIGLIIRDDCEVYRTRFETLKAELTAKLGPIKTSVKMGNESLRDPSQLMQILAHRTHALCRDFNACRVPPQQYRQRREQADHLFTAVGAISSQLKGDLPDDQKAVLVAKLISLLSEDRRSTTPSTSGRRPRPKLSRGRRYTGGVRYRSWLPWFGTKMLPPQPKTATGAHMVHAKFSLRHVFRSGQGAVGYGLRGSFLIRGRLQSDDLITMRYGSKSVDCRISKSSRGQNGLVSVRCATLKKEALTAASLRIVLSHQVGGEGKARLMGERVLRILSRISNPRNGSRSFGEDHDRRARNLRLVFRPYPATLPPAFEQPSILAVLKMRDYRRKSITARCWVDGKVTGPAIIVYGRYSGQVGQFQDRDRYRRVGPGSSVSVKLPFITWRRYDFPLPFHVRRTAGGSPPENTRKWPKAGSWRCVVSIEGQPVREAHFRVKDSGMLDSVATQARRPRAAWLLDTKVIASQYEEPLR